MNLFDSYVSIQIMGGGSFLVAINSVEDIIKIKEFAPIIGSLVWDLLEQEYTFEQIEAILSPLAQYLLNGSLKYTKELSHGDTDLVPYNFQYYCGKIWIRISTYTPGLSVIEIMMNSILKDNNYTRLSSWCVPLEDCDKVPFIKPDKHVEFNLDDNMSKYIQQLWDAHIEKFKTIERKIIKYNSKRNFIDFDRMKVKNPDRYERLLQYSDKP